MIRIAKPKKEKVKSGKEARKNKKVKRRKKGYGKQWKIERYIYEENMKENQESKKCRVKKIKKQKAGKKRQEKIKRVKQWKKG